MSIAWFSLVDPADSSESLLFSGTFFHVLVFFDLAMLVCLSCITVANISKIFFLEVFFAIMLISHLNDCLVIVLPLNPLDLAALFFMT
jgi:hypothetical protein